MIFRLLVFFNVFLCSPLCIASEVIPIHDSIPERIYSLRTLDYFEDTSNKLTIDDISATSFQTQFALNPNYTNNAFNKNATYWIKLSIRHNPRSKKLWLLEFYDQTIDEIVAYLPDQKGSFNTIKMGDLMAFEERLFRHKNFEILLDNDSNEVKDYYFKITSHNFADIRIAVRSVDRFIYYALNEYFLFGIFYGMIIIISLYNLLMFFAVKERQYLYYIFYLLSVAAYAMCMDGIGFQYLWPDNPEWNQIAFGIFLFLIIFWALLFSKTFLKPQVRAPFLNKLFLLVIIGRCILFALALFYNHELFDLQYIETVPLILIFYTSIYVWSKGYKPARFFVVAYGVLFIGFFVKALVISGMLPFGIIMYYSLHISFLLEMLLLSFALGDRVRILKNKRDRAQIRIIQQLEVNEKLKDQINQELSLNVTLKEQVNKELEQKVSERTKELDEKNKQLEQINQKLINQAKEINQINSILDLDNWKLKNNIKEALEDRFLNKDLELDEFNKIFPDELACYRYLDKLKWPKDFSCKKCANDKYFDGLQKFSRRCTRCGYNESITAYSIFHGIKFPIEKAFYIAYITLNNHGAYTLEELSKILTLRTNTIWGFKIKINNLLKSKKSEYIKGEIWKDILVDHHPLKHTDLKLDGPKKRAKVGLK